MAMDYTGSPNGLFLVAGKPVKHYNLQQTDGGNLDADLAEIADVFQAMTSGAPELIFEGFATQVDGWKAQYKSRRGALKTLVDRRLQDRETVVEELGLTSTSVSAIVARLIEQMDTDSYYVTASAVTIGSVTSSGNTGDGTLLTTKKLDGVNSPASAPIGSYPPHVFYLELDSQLAMPDEDMILRCDDDVTEGSESFVWTGKIQDAAHGLEVEPGSGTISSGVTPINSSASNYVANGRIEDQEDFEAVDLGPFGGSYIEYSTITGTPYNAIRFNDNQAAAGPPHHRVRQLISTTLVANQSYWLMARVRASDASPFDTAGKKINIYVGTASGTPLQSPGAVDAEVTVTQAAFGTSFALLSVQWWCPTNVVDPVYLWVDVDGDIDTAKWIDVWDLAVAPVIYGGGIGIGLVQGEDTTYVAGDQHTWNVSNDEAGTWQNFWREAYGVQLPTSGSNLIADALAE